MRVIVKPTCHPTREYWAKGLCKACYLSDYYHANLDRLRAKAHEYYVKRIGKEVSCKA